MNAETLRRNLERTGRALGALMDGVDATEAEWKPKPDRWSLVEVANHLADEEVEDFRTRVRMIADDPSETWPAIDPFGWVESREYAKRPYAASVSRWKAERSTTLEWLVSGIELDADVKYRGSNADYYDLRCGDLVLSWIAHDYFHIRQITILRWEYLYHAGAPYSPRYAGEME